MTGHHPWLKHSPEKVRDKLDAVSRDAAFLWSSVQIYLAASGGDGTIAIVKLPLATARRLTAAQIRPLVVELVGEGLVERTDDTAALAFVPWEQPPVETWTDDTLRMRWRRKNQLHTMSDLKQAIRERDRNLCRYCGVRVNWAHKKGRLQPVYEHVDPDGINELANVVIACKPCNTKKRDRTPEQAGMPLYTPGTTAEVIAAGRGRLYAASAARGRTPDHRDVEDDPVPIQLGSESESNHGPSPPCAPARKESYPDRIQIRSESGLTVEGPGTGAPADMNAIKGDRDG